MKDNVKSVLNGILELFKDGSKLPKAIAIVQFPNTELPSSKWSLLNKIIMILSDTEDARGYRQWLEAKRYVKKGVKAIHILVPIIKKKKDEEKPTDKSFLAGFMLKPVFRFEDTDGEPLEYQKLELPELPLLDRAKEWGISVKPVSGNNSFHGYYSQSRGEIGLATAEETVFYHELIHCSDGKCIGSLKGGQDPLQEIVAELGALALCNIVGKDGNKFIGNSYQYIESYAEKLNINPHYACIKVISRVEKALNLILNRKEAEYV
jgi:hypothetical protein